MFVDQQDQKRLKQEVIQLPHQVTIIVLGNLPNKEHDRGPLILPMKLGVWNQKEFMLIWWLT